jgi:hypothetical protein
VLGEKMNTPRKQKKIATRKQASKQAKAGLGFPNPALLNF